MQSIRAHSLTDDQSFFFFFFLQLIFLLIQYGEITFSLTICYIALNLISYLAIVESLPIKFSFSCIDSTENQVQILYKHIVAFRGSYGILATLKIASTIRNFLRSKLLATSSIVTKLFKLTKLFQLNALQSIRKVAHFLVIPSSET